MKKQAFLFFSLLGFSSLACNIDLDKVSCGGKRNSLFTACYSGVFCDSLRGSRAGPCLERQRVCNGIRNKISTCGDDASRSDCVRLEESLKVCLGEDVYASARDKIKNHCDNALVGEGAPPEDCPTRVDDGSRIGEQALPSQDQPGGARPGDGRAK